jgi:ElaB/YqjD/DUF883 family membrane-anchored ribosome-binding protein
MSALKSINEAIRDVPTDLASLREDIAKLTNTVTDLVSKQASDATESIMGVVGDAGKKLSETTADAREGMSNLGAGMESTIERNPMISILLAFSSGIFLGLLSRGLGRHDNSTKWQSP